MKTLLLMRHAKSDWKAEFGRDHDRPLSKRGVRTAKAIGAWLSRAGCAPDSVVTSSATRARTTVELAAEAGGWSCPIRVTPSFYESSPRAVLAEIRREADASAVTLAAGHEPVWSELAGRLVGGARLHFVTAAVVRIDLPIEKWGDVDLGQGVLAWMITPRIL